MKNLILFIIFMVGTLSSYSQPTKELANQARDKFEGKWVGHANGDSITIFLLQTIWKMERIHPVDTIAYLYGWHQINNAHGIIQSDLVSMSDDPSSGFTVIASYKKDLKQIHLTIRDISRHKLLDAVLTLINANEAILTTTIRQTCFVDSNYREGKSFSNEVRLTRITKNIRDYITTKSLEY